ncbi:MAG: family 20 glycosylhydrolase, partial [Clostridiales bacterium]|nr:family 20 glycosylhydrolase [Clostridiales bacterium]
MLERLNNYSVFDGLGALSQAVAGKVENIPLREVIEKIAARENGDFTSLLFLPVDEEIKCKIKDTFDAEYREVEDCYVVDTTCEEIKVYSDSMSGHLYGANTLLAQSYFNDGLIPKGLIYNIPRCPFRGLKVYMPASDDLDSFYRTVDLLGYLRCNKLIIEVGGAMEYKSHPEINEAWLEFCKEMNKYPDRANEIQNKTYPWAKNSIHFENGGGKYLTQDTVRKLVKYCTDRGFEVIPEMPTLSHADYLLMPHPELAERKEDMWPDVYCPSNPGSYELVFDLFEEVIDVFNPKIMHIGHDEYYSIGICDKCKGKSGEQIYADDINKLYDYLAERGIRTMLWAEKLIDAISMTGVHYGGSELRKRYSDGTVEIVRPATFKSIDMVPRDIIAHHWYHSIQNYFDDEYLKRGMDMVYGNFTAHTFLDWNRRLAAGAKGGAPSHWSSLEDDTLQRNAVFLSLIYSTELYWDEDYDDAKFPQYLDECFYELFMHCNRDVMARPHFEIVHTTTIKRPYVYISSLPMQLEKDTIGKYIVTYDDGTVHEIPIVYGLNITNKNRTWGRKYHGDAREDFGVAERDSYMVDSLLVEVGYTALPMKDGSDTIFKIEAENPYPEKRIMSVDVVKVCDDEGDIIL